MNSALLILAASLFTWGIGDGMFYYFQPLYLAELGADPIQIGAILGAAGTAMTVVHIPAGYLADRFGRRPLLRASWTFGLFASVLMATARSLPLFIGGLILYSFTAFVVSPLYSYVTAARGKWTVERAITLVSATFSLGMVLGPLLGGWLGERFGLRSLYIGAFAIFALSTALIYNLPAQAVHHAAHKKSPKALLHNKSYLRFLGLLFFVMVATYLPQPLTQNFLQDVRELSLTQIGMLGSLSAIGTVVLNLLLGQFSAKRGFLLGQFFTALFALLIWRGSGIGVFGLAYFLLGGYRAARSLATAYVNSLVSDAQMGLAYGLSETISTVSLMLTPPLAGYLYAQNPVSPYPLSLMLISFSLILTVIFFPRSKNSTLC
jgi:MFS family permease